MRNIPRMTIEKMPGYKRLTLLPTAPLVATDGLVALAMVDAADGMVDEFVAPSVPVVVTIDAVHIVQVLDTEVVESRVIEETLFSADTMTCFKSTLNSCMQNSIASALI
jgi:hypothetical protein